ncbi:uncharacterized protein PFL1_05513 [Pseudozyma flocculosa PF-1]|uniref:Uncharacterized protein n=1 Tax=Pseudozyma flocculosa PF-1 TaxID=1277687 RepID=A0A061H324_9BASI|nr:uncharacterized protein PFL1_05513 [Pseudozyma flocculosa PF-1]EPQ26878.1 hypothetical protein PFL1_05513 [Pseudozyma flocculosa PF-1]
MLPTASASSQLRRPLASAATLRRFGAAVPARSTAATRRLHSASPPPRPASLSLSLSSSSPPLPSRQAAARKLLFERSGTGAGRNLAPGSCRPYSSEGGPNQQQVLQSFATPFAQFVYTISRIARMITVSALGIAVVGLGGYEATHQYIEHFAMPHAPASSSVDDPWGWNEQLGEESWSGSGSSGTDRRLGIKGRHAVRSAWMCVHWGGGISPGLILGGAASGSSGLGRTAQSSIAGQRDLHIEDGMVMAMRYLSVALQAAREKGIVLPDIDAVRAGLASSSAPLHIDPTALALESKMASIRERHGSRGATANAIEGYERVFDLLMLSAAAPSQVQSGGDAQSAKLVRLATKIGDLNAAIGQKTEAESWLQKAVELAGAGSSASSLAAASSEAGQETLLATEAAAATGAPSSSAGCLTALDEARAESKRVLDALAVAAAAKGKPSKQDGTTAAASLPKLASRWQDKTGLQVFAQRLARDAVRVEQTAEKLQKALGAQA